METPSETHPAPTRADLEVQVELEKKARATRALAAIDEICKRENVALVVPALIFVEGKLVPRIEVTAI